MIVYLVVLASVPASSLSFPSLLAPILPTIYYCWNSSGLPPEVKEGLGTREGMTRERTEVCEQRWNLL